MTRALDPEQHFASPETVGFAPAPTPSGVLMVVFSAANAAKFTFYKNTEHLDCDRLYVRDPHLNAWFQRGFLTDRSFDASVEALRTFAAGYDRVLMTGSSMGGYASILFGTLVRSDRIFAIGPQTILNTRYSRSPHRSVSLVHPDIAPLIAEAEPGKLDILVGLLDAVDYYNIARVGDLGAAGINAFAGEDHFLPKSLSRSGDLSRAFTDVLNGTPLTFPGYDCADAYRFDDHRAAVIREVVPRLFEEKSYKRVRSLMREALIEDPEWPLGKYLWSAAAFKLGDFDKAHSRLRRAALTYPKAIDFNSLAAEAALALDLRPQAETYARNLIQIRTNHRRARDILSGEAQPVASAQVVLDEPPTEG